MAVRHARIAIDGPFEGDLPNAQFRIGLLEFFDLDELIRRDVFEQLLSSTSGPRHFDRSDRCGFANADVLHQR